MNWSQYNPVRVFAGKNIRAKLYTHLPEGDALLLTTRGMLARESAKELMESCPLSRWTVHTINANPDLDFLDRLGDELREKDFVAVVALGGGSVIDAAKVLSVLLHAESAGMLHNWLKKSDKPNLPSGLPLFCLPTTAGTGAEVTPFATVWDEHSKRKCSLAGEQLYADSVFLDPELTLSLPWDMTLYSALDALSHSLETMWNRHATPLSVIYASGAIDMILANLRLVEQDLTNLAARECLQQASFLAGLAISQSRTALAHSMSYPLTAKYAVPHGLACSFSLAAIIELVKKEHAWVGGMDESAVNRITDLLARCNLPEHIRRYCTTTQIMACIDEMFTPGRADNFVLPVDKQQLRNLIQTAF